METEFIVVEKNGVKYRKNHNTTGRCIYHLELKCVCCNPECAYNCSVDDELENELENDLLNIIG